MTFRWAASLVVGAVALVTAVCVPLAVETSQPSSTPPAPSVHPPTSTTTTTAPSPNLVGKTLAEAQAAPVSGQPMPWEHLSLDVVDRSVPAETIISEKGTSLTIAVPGDAICTQTQLAATYLWNQGAVGNWYAGIVVRNVSSTWCALPGPLHLVGLSRAGEPITTTLNVTFSNPLADVLSPNTPPAPEPPPSTGVGLGRYPIDVLYAYVGFGGPYGVCQPPQNTPQGSEPHVTPASWRISVPRIFLLTTANGTPVEAAKLPTTTYEVRVAHPFWSCGGAIVTAGPEFQ